MITNTQTQFAFAMSDEGPIEESILHAARRLGYHDLREQQLHAAKKFLQGNDVFVSPEIIYKGIGNEPTYYVLTRAIRTESLYVHQTHKHCEHFFCTKKYK